MMESGLKCSFYSFSDETCGQNQSSDSIVALSTCTKSVQNHLRYLKVSSATIKEEWELILARTGNFSLLEGPAPLNFTICPRHRETLGFKWRPKRTCQHPEHDSSSSAKPDRGINLEKSLHIWNKYHILVPIGTGK